jgi:hypothetical protein
MNELNRHINIMAGHFFSAMSQANLGEMDVANSYAEEAKKELELVKSLSTPAPDWDGGKEECGGGLHFSPRPSAALAFDNLATRFIACPVLLKEIKVHSNATYPEKVKAPRVYKPCYEVDIDGNKKA